MLTFDDDYLFTLNIVNRFKETYPNVEGIIAPYHGSSYDSEGLTITVCDAAKEASYRISLFARYKKLHGTPIANYCVRLSELRPFNNGNPYVRYQPIGKVDLLLKPGAAIDGTIG